MKKVLVLMTFLLAGCGGVSQQLQQDLIDQAVQNYPMESVVSGVVGGEIDQAVNDARLQLERESVARQRQLERRVQREMAEAEHLIQAARHQLPQVITKTIESGVSPEVIEEFRVVMGGLQSQLKGTEGRLAAHRKKVTEQQLEIYKLQDEIASRSDPVPTPWHRQAETRGATGGGFVLLLGVVIRWIFQTIRKQMEV